jgi:four helix bundle protein
VERSAIVLSLSGCCSSIPERIDSCSFLGMAGVRRYEDFDCWKLSNELKLALYELLERPHVRIDREFCEDLRDAAKSAPTNIAEGFGRRTDKEFARFLDIARGSLNECRTHIGDARDRRYIDDDERSTLDALASRALGAVAGLQRYLRRKGGGEQDGDRRGRRKRR